MTSQAIRQLEEQMAAARQQIELGRALSRLMSNKDFRDVIVKGYLEKEAVRLVHKRAEANTQGPFPQEINLRRIDGIGFFNEYLKQVAEAAEIAAHQLVEDEQTRDELIADAGE